MSNNFIAFIHRLIYQKGDGFLKLLLADLVLQLLNGTIDIPIETRWNELPFPPDNPDWNQWYNVTIASFGEY